MPSWLGHLVQCRQVSFDCQTAAGRSAILRHSRHRIIPQWPPGVKHFLKISEKKNRATRSDSDADLYTPLYPGLYPNVDQVQYAEMYAELDTVLSTELYTVGRYFQVPTPKSDARFAGEPTVIYHTNRESFLPSRKRFCRQPQTGKVMSPDWRG